MLIMRKMVIYRILLVVLVLSLILLGCQAKFYRESFEPYEVNFNASNTSISADYSPAEDSSDRTHIDEYHFKFDIPGTHQKWGYLSVMHFYKTIERNLDKEAESIKVDGKSNGYTCNSSHRIIDGHDGVVVYCSGSEPCNKYHAFGYQIDNMTSVGGMVDLDWYTPMQPFLDSLHLSKRQRKSPISRLN